ncbi:hypothetical protein H6F43_06060 [Leptolyngbya sp. FACHB-36]|uniref:hypothetical protein n=1 Tax=Leptolyngbya sp. FACHB-36 TaxID=2692808 RepID=UPI00168179AC|nr:hypothetical protein [Leptolyngbya sp. FACHB-36]MBD2019751.1 hypothetical protein [Leptolyngbya sp. FACHB-36]
MASVLGFGVGLMVFLLLMLLTFAGLQWLQLPVGNLVDWLIGGASFAWLVLIVTVPWNIHFQAKAVLADAEASKEMDIPIDRQQLSYVRSLAQRSFWIAIVLHLVSALGLYGLSATGLSPIGYISSGAALLLTVLRPTIAAYQYFADRLSRIGEAFVYPREDVVELRQRVVQLETSVKQLEDQLNSDLSDSWAATQQRNWNESRAGLAQVSATLETLRATNLAEHDRLSHESRHAIAQLSTDSQFLEHVREIIRFFKAA